MDVKTLVSVETWPTRPCEYTDEHGRTVKGIYISSCRMNGMSFNYILREDGVNVIVPESQVRKLDSASVRVQILVRG
jgi:hypothetical protein